MSDANAFEVGSEFTKFLKRHARPRSPWVMLNLIACDFENIMVVLARMGFEYHLDTYPPHSLDWFPNADWDVLAMAPPGKGALLIFVDAGSGAWRTRDGTKRGADLISLGCFMWNLPYGKAAWKIAGICGLRELPRAQ